MAERAGVVIVGASIGGLTAGETLRQEGFEGEIVLVGEEPDLPYTRPPLSKQILLGQWEPADAAIRSREELDALGIRVHTGRRATGLDLRARTLRTDDGDLSFDELVIATGTESRVHPALPWAPSLRGMSDALRLRDRLRAARSVVVVGSGILGSEIASAARKNDTQTVLLGRSGTLGFGGVGALLTEPLAALHRAHGVELALRSDIVHAEPVGDGGSEIVLADGTTRRADLVVTMIGGTPRTGWLTSSGLDLRDGVACDSSGRAAPGVWAVGDVAAWRDDATGRHVRVEHQSNAIEQAVAVALRITRDAASTAPVPLFWSEIHGTRIHAYGWFDPSRPLTSSAEPGAASTVYTQRSANGSVRGVVGWNAPPRQFRLARAAVATGASALTPQR